MAARTQTPIPTKYDYRDLVDTPQSFSGVEIIDAGTDAIYLPNEVVFFGSGFTLNTQSDGLGTNITGYTVEELDDFLTNKWGQSVYQKVKITDPTYQTGTIYAFGDIAGSIVDAEDTNRLQSQISDLSPAGGGNYAIGDTYYTFNPANRLNMLRFDFDNAVSKTDFADLYAVVGDMFEDQHVDAGDPASGSSDFYPTPIPGAFSRSAYPDARFTDSEVSVAGNSVDLGGNSIVGMFPDGTPFYLTTDGTLPTGLSENTVYYLNESATPELYTFHTTEADGISGNSPVTITATGSGVFYLKQAGIYLDDAFQGHKTGQRFGGSVSTLPEIGAGAAGPSVFGARAGSSSSTTSNQVLTDGSFYDDGTNGTPRTSNETRPKEVIQYGFIVYQNLSINIPPASSKYDTGWILMSSGWQTQEVTVTHNLDSSLDGLIIETLFSTDGTDSNAIYTEGSLKNGASGAIYGMNPLPIDNNGFKLQTASGGIQVIQDDGSSLNANVQTTYYIRIVVYKPEAIAQTTNTLMYTTNWLQMSSGWQNQEVNVNHSLNTPLSDLITKIHVSTDGTEANAFELLDGSSRNPTNTTSASYGSNLLAVDDNNFKLQTASNGVQYVNDSGSQIILSTQTTFYIKITAYKPNITDDVINVSNTQLINITSATDETVNLPDANVAVKDYTYMRTGSGAGKVIFNAYGSQTVGGQAASFWNLGGHDDNSILVITPLNGNWQVKKFYDGTYRLQDVKSQGTPGGSSISGRNTRDLNTEQNTAAWGSLSSNQFTLDAGLYRIKALSYVYRSNRNRLFVVSDPSGTPTDVESSICYYAPASNNGESNQEIYTTLKITASETYEIQSYTHNAFASQGLGVETNETGKSELYTDVIITRELCP